MAGAGPLSRLAIILGALTAFGPLSIAMYLPSSQAISRDLAASPAQVQLTRSRAARRRGEGRPRLR